VTARHLCSRTKIYMVWRTMKQRCLNPNSAAFVYYGGRGITICARWRDSFDAFLADMGKPAAGMTLDRIDNDRGYEPGNCRWATRKDQQRNTRRSHLVEWNGQTKSLAAWAEVLGVKPNTLVCRLSHGWSVERAFSTVVRSRSDATRR
jgi:hypothetical protein